MKLTTKLEKLKSSNKLKNYVIKYILDDHKTDDEIKVNLKGFRQIMARQ
ncbi:hypothetical protein UFOVP286_16 [uncultured Caudovirales phage]|uniref:Uncharacterized protein n=1 Tax=uncultured Caudovirales phage TaxID=2100421 RepID=A0A6J5LRN1_9CAUD|nr:hypothetical protein UFOVP286_16 [uncultured Caudovirales phage]